jgi:V8-like Glu-specific endopeptidase
VAFLIVDFENSSRRFGTAIFINEKYLLTAGHCVYDKHRRMDAPKIRVVTPGLPYVDYGKLEKGQVLTMDCTIVKNLFKGVSGPNECDIALLHAGTSNGPLGIELSSTPPPPGAVVDVIGYPGTAVPGWLKKKLVEETIHDFNETIETVRKLLPDRTLTISRGYIEKTGDNLISYNVSTVPGMSGSCLLYKGKVIGISIILVL